VVSFTYGLVYDALSSSDHIASHRRIITELERMWKEAAEKPQKPLVLGVGVSVEIPTDRLLNTSYEHYNLSQLTLFL
jgi:hypothetical protein